MQTETKKTSDGTIEITVTVTWSKVKTEYDKIVGEAIKNVEVKGFRKGKAPRELAEKKLNNEKLWQQVLEKVIPQYYSQALQKEQLKPIITPQIQLLKAARDNDLVFKATTAEAPQVELGDYKQVLAKVKKPAPKIWTPEQKKSATEKEEKINLEQVLQKLLKHIKINIAPIIVDQQTNRNLTQLLDQVKQVGMTIQQYAQSKGKTVEQIRKEAEEEAAKTLKLEFILEKIADVEKISVDNKEIEDFINKSKDGKEKDALKQQSYYIASLLRRQKTLQSLLG